MAVNITEFGRVEFDPMRIPTSTVAGTESEVDTAFAEELDKVVRRNEEDVARDSEPDAGANADEESQAVAEQPPRSDSRPEANDSEDAGRTEPDAQPAGPVEARTAAAAADNNNKQTHEGRASASREIAGKGAGALPSYLSTSSPVNGSPAGSASAALTATSGIGGAAQPQPPATAAATTAANPAVPTTSNTSGANGRAAPTQATPGYRTLNAPTLQLAEQVRDSVFRQIALRINPTGGEMRVLVDPPQLGELEMKMVVQGDKLQLSVVAERPEIAVMMQKHIAELRQHLEAQGFVVGDTDVRTRDSATEQQNEGRGERGENEFEQGNDEADSPTGIEQAPRGFMTAAGFDLWI